MTVSSTSNRKTYTGDGATVAFATSPVIFFDEGDLKVYKVVTATGAATLQVITTDYTVSGGAGSTGTVTMVVAPTAAQTLVIVRELDLVQEVDLVNNEATDAEVAEDALDKLTMMVQQVSAAGARTVRLADSDVTGASTVLPTPDADKVLGWDAAGTALENKVPADLDLALVSAFIETLLDDANAADARTTLGLGTMAVEAAASYIAKAIGTAAGSTIYWSGAGTPVELATGTAYQKLRVNSGATAPQWASLAPTRQVFTSGTGATYTTPAGCVAINVRCVGGGGGGSGATANPGSAGTATTFSGSSMSAGGGSGGNAGSLAGASGGSSSGGDINITGGAGCPPAGNTIASAAGSDAGGTGGNSAFGGAGAAAQAGATNSGGGGGGGSGNATFGGGGGGAGGYCEKLIAAPAASYTYTVGQGGAGGAAGTTAGGAGAAGIIIVDEYY